MNIAAYPRYGSYRDSGAEWIGEYPVGWELTRLGGLFQERRSKVSDSDFQPLSVTKNGILPQLETAAKTNDGDNRKLVRAGDFVINSRSDRKGSSGVSPLDGSVSLINIVLEPKQILPEFCHYLLKSYAFVEEYYRVGRGIVADLWTTRFDEMRTILVALPSQEEQRAIAAFLDKKCATVDEAVRIKEEQITFLRERRQILIQQAVTRGLNPSATMKDSGIDWIGQIPAHWEVKQFKHLLSEPLKYGANEEAKECVEGDPRYIRITDFGSDGKLKGDTKRTLPRRIASDYFLEQGDILLARSGGTVGKSFLFLEDMEACFAGYLIRARCKREAVSYEYMSLFLRSPSFEHWKELIFSRATIQNIGADKYGALLLPVPPASEQHDILRNANDFSAKIDRAISVKEDQIEALKEYKTSLINAAITGKIKVVSGAAPEAGASSDVKLSECV